MCSSVGNLCLKTSILDVDIFSTCLKQETWISQSIHLYVPTCLLTISMEILLYVDFVVNIAATMKIKSVKI